MAQVVTNGAQARDRLRIVLGVGARSGVILQLGEAVRPKPPGHQGWSAQAAAPIAIVSGGPPPMPATMM
jgi:hypothetical protein